MELGVLESYDTVLILLGIAILGAIVLPRLLSERPLSFPIIYVAFGMLVFQLPLGLEPPHPLEHGQITEHLAELAVIVALMGAGLRIDRPFRWSTWTPTWRLLGITMPLTIAGAGLLGWALGFHPATAMLLGAVIAPTDPVLAADVEVRPPLDALEEGVPPEEHEEEVRFSLTSEAGLNDGLAFPFTNAAIAMTVVGVAPEGWLPQWIMIDVVYRIGAGLVVGLLVGRVLGKLLFGQPAMSQLARAMQGVEALAATLIAYGAAELIGGYGFIAVFVAALSLRDFERTHGYHRELHEFSEVVERLLMAVILVLLGGAVVGGLLRPLTWPAVALGLAIVLGLRPLAGLLGLAGFRRMWEEKAVISFFGIRGVGTIYYLSYALNEGDFAQAELIWAVAGFVVLTSIVVHGITATPAMNAIDRRKSGDRPTGGAGPTEGERAAHDPDV